MNHKIRFFPVGNGDTVLLETHGTTILTDVNYRCAAEDDADQDTYDFADDLRKACKTGADYRLDIFVLTHPDDQSPPPHAPGFIHGVRREVGVDVLM